jgi:hypothetical protein
MNDAQELQKPDRSALDLLIRGGFDPSAVDIQVLVNDKEAQRRIICARLANKQLAQFDNKTILDSLS